jgi:hypothetical protein
VVNIEVTLCSIFQGILEVFDLPLHSEMLSSEQFLMLHGLWRLPAPPGHLAFARPAWHVNGTPMPIFSKGFSRDHS